MRIVVTGGIACGKSTVSNALLKHLPGYVLVSADQMVHDLYATNVEFQAGLMARFGTTDRRAISAIVFAAPERRADLEALSWVYLEREVDRVLAQENIIFEFPLFFESKRWIGRPDAVVVLGCDIDVQRQRAMARDGISADALARILAAQMPAAQKAVLADIYLDTSGTLDEVLAMVATIPGRLRSMMPSV